MKNAFIVCAAFALLTLTDLHPAFAQGSLTPPGAPAPTMKTLQQVEPRIPLGTVAGDSGNLHIITQPGSYYLDGYVVVGSGTNGIRIMTNDVTIDLNGFTLSGSPIGTAILSGAIGLSRITVRNGRLAGWFSGINFLSFPAADVVVADIQIQTSGGGSSAYGIACGTGGQINRCSVVGLTGIASYGIVAATGSTIESCAVDTCNGGVILGPSITLKSCQVRNCGPEDSVNVGANSSIEDCHVLASANGFRFGSSSVVLNNTVLNCTNGSGFRIAGSFCRVEGNLAGGNSVNGFTTDGTVTNTFFVRNVARGNVLGNYAVFGTQVSGPIVTNLGTITTNSPWANFSY